jgi:hypothetical protein
MECWRHVLPDQSKDPIWPRGAIIRGAAEGLLHNRKSDMSGDHLDGIREGWSDPDEPGKWSSGRECGVRGESHRFHLREFCYGL